MNDNLVRGYKDGFGYGRTGSVNAGVPPHRASDVEYVTGFVGGRDRGAAEHLTAVADGAKAITAAMNAHGVNAIAGYAARNFPSVGRRRSY